MIGFALKALCKNQAEEPNFVKKRQNKNAEEANVPAYAEVLA